MREEGRGVGAEAQRSIKWQVDVKRFDDMLSTDLRGKEKRFKELSLHLAARGLGRQLLGTLFTGNQSVVRGLGALENVVSIRNLSVTLGCPPDSGVQHVTQPLHDSK